MNLLLYARVSTKDQTCENQLRELRAYAAASEHATVREFVDTGVSGGKRSRPALDALLSMIRETTRLGQRGTDRPPHTVVAVWSLDRLGRSLQHLIELLREFGDRNVRFVSLKDSIDYSTAAGQLVAHILGALAQFEKVRITERVVAGLARRKAAGLPLGRPRRRVRDDVIADLSLSVRQAAKQLRCSPVTVFRRRSELKELKHATD